MRPLFTASACLLLIAAIAQPGAAASELPKTELVSRSDRRTAEREYKRGLQAQMGGRSVEALQRFSSAADLNPYQPEYAGAEELARQQAVYEFIARGNELQGKNQPLLALASFRQALELDPKSEVAQSRMRDVLPSALPGGADPVAEARRRSLRLVAQSDEVEIEPAEGARTLQFRGDSRQFIEQVAALYGITVVFDESFTSRQVRVDVPDVDWSTAIDIAMRLSKTFAVPLSSKQILVANDTRTNRQNLERMSVRTFAIESASTPQELNDFTNVLRSIFDFRFVNPNAARSLIFVRGPKAALDAAAALLSDFPAAKPQVMLELKIYEVNHTMLRQIGVDMPTQFRLFNVETELRNLVATPGVQDLINQLFSTGGLNQIDPTAIAALLAQLQSSGNSLIGQPIVTFGGGKTRTGVVVPPVGGRLNYNENWFYGLSKVMLRGAHGDTATFRAGSRYPILNASFAPIFNNPQLTQAVQNQSYQPAFPSFSYEDLGLTLKAKPTVSARGEVTMELEIQIKSLTGSAFNSIPIISNREFKSSITIADGQTAVIAGSIVENETNSFRGLPGFGKIPILKHLTGTSSKDVAQNQLLLLITPRVVRQTEFPAESSVMIAN